MTAWNNLSIPEKAEMMRVAIANGITTLPEIRQAYNQFAEGGNSNNIATDKTERQWTIEDENNFNAWRKSLPKNLRTETPNYDLRGAYLAGLQPTLENDGYYHLGSRDPQTGRILKAPTHPTYLKALVEDAALGYYPTIDNRGNTYTETWKGNKFAGGGHVYEVLPQMLKNAGLNVKVTSGYRKAGQAGKAGKKSWHTRHGAVDIVPQGKTTFEDIENALYSNPAIYRYMLTNGLGLLDESGRSVESRATMKKTGASGPHFHIGKDTTPARRYAQRMSSVWDNNMNQLTQQINTPQSTVTMPEEIPFTPWNPQALYNEQPLVTYAPPTLETTQPLVETANAYTQEALEKEQRQRNLNTLGFVLGMTNPQGSDNSLINTIGMLAGSGFAKGGKIHIKPENRGKFTALKKRTGHSATWFKQHGTPAQKKMAAFALNARKWKHGLGGNIFSGEDTPTQQMSVASNGVITTPEGIQIFRPYYDYSRVDKPLTRNASIPEIVIKPDSTLTPWERSVRERERAKNHDAKYGQGTYAALRSRENTEAAVNKAQKEWNNSTEKKVLDAAIGLAEGVGIGSDIVATSMGGAPVYSALKGSQAFGRAVNSGNPLDYAESALWLLPEVGVAGKEGYNIGSGYLKGLFKRAKKAYSRFTKDTPFYFDYDYQNAMQGVIEPLARAKAEYPVYVSAGEKDAFRNRYSRYLESSPANKIDAFDYSAFNYGNEEIERLKSLFRHNPEYFVHVRDTKVADPLSQEAIDNFINRQLTSIRGVVAPDKETAIQYLTTTETGRYMPGGDRLGTQGGLYTSNNPMIGDRFKNPTGNNTANGYVGILKEPDTIDRTKSIEEQLRQLRNRTAFGEDLLEGTQYIGNLDRSNAKLLEAPYVGRASQGTGGYERAYLPTGKKGEVTSPVEIQSLEEFINQTDQHGRWGYGLDAVTNPDLFIAKQLNAYDDYIQHARAILTPGKETNWDIYNTEYKKLYEPIEKRIQRRKDLIYKANDRKGMYEGAKQAAPWLLGGAGVTGGIFGSAAYVGAKNRKIDEYVENGMLRYGHENEPILVLTAKGEIDTPEDLLQIVEDSKENYQKRLERKERRNKRKKQE